MQLKILCASDLGLFSIFLPRSLVPQKVLRQHYSNHKEKLKYIQSWNLANDNNFTITAVSLGPFDGHTIEKSTPRPWKWSYCGRGQRRPVTSKSVTCDRDMRLWHVTMTCDCYNGIWLTDCDTQNCDLWLWQCDTLKRRSVPVAPCRVTRSRTPKLVTGHRHTREKLKIAKINILMWERFTSLKWKELIKGEKKLLRWAWLIFNFHSRSKYFVWHIVIEFMKKKLDTCIELNTLSEEFLSRYLDFPCFRFVWMRWFVFRFVLCQFGQIFVKYLWPGILPIVSKPTLPFEFTNKVPLWRPEARRQCCRPIGFEHKPGSTNGIARALCGG